MTSAGAGDAEGLRPHEAAILLGVPSREVYRLLSARELEAYRLGERLVIRRSSVERWQSQRSG